MKDIKAILEEHGQSLDSEAAGAILRDVQENYRTVAEVEKKAARISELEARQKELTEQVGALEGQGDEVQALKKRVADYEQAEKERVAEAREATRRAEFERAFEGAVGSREFANDLVRDSVMARAMDACSKDSTLGVKEAVEAATKDVPGVWRNPQKDPAKMPDPKDVSSRKGNTEEDAKRDLARSLFG